MKQTTVALIFWEIAVISFAVGNYISFHNGYGPFVVFGFGQLAVVLAVAIMADPRT